MDKKQYLDELNQELHNKNKSKQYISACLTYAENLIDSGLPVIFDLQHLSLLIGIDVNAFNAFLHSIDKYCYHEMKIPKKTGGIRVLDIPSVDLKYIQRWILDNILSHMHISKYATGFTTGKSILTNAKMHVGKECIINFDIKDFFPSISFEQVFYLFKYYGYTKELSYFLTKLCMHNGYLPQGSPASPSITNILCLKLDKRLGCFAEKYGATYSRYADDITFSGSKGIVSIIPVVKEIIENEGFMLNEKKTHIAYAHQRQMVTGLVVNNGIVRVPKDFKRKLRQEIYYCRKFGVMNHQQYKKDDHSFYKEHLYGKAYFINMVEPDEGQKFLQELDEIIWGY